MPTGRPACQSDLGVSNGLRICRRRNESVCAINAIVLSRRCTERMEQSMYVCRRYLFVHVQHPCSSRVQNAMQATEACAECTLQALWCHEAIPCMRSLVFSVWAQRCIRKSLAHRTRRCTAVGYRSTKGICRDTLLYMVPTDSALLAMAVGFGYGEWSWIVDRSSVLRAHIARCCCVVLSLTFLRISVHRLVRTTKTPIQTSLFTHNGAAATLHPHSMAWH